MNNVSIIGRLARDWKEVDKKKDSFMAFNTVAVNKGDKADFIPVCVTGEVGKNAVKYTSKGDRVGIQGAITVYTKDTDGQKHTEFYVSGRSVDFLQDKKADNSEGVPFKE